MRRGLADYARGCSPVTCGDWVEYQQEEASPAAGSPYSCLSARSLMDEPGGEAPWGTTDAGMGRSWFRLRRLDGNFLRQSSLEEPNVCGSASFHVSGYLRLGTLMAAGVERRNPARRDAPRPTWDESLAA